MINEYISKFKIFDKYGGALEDTFMNGFCYYFAKILESNFPTGRIYYDAIVNHFVFCCKDKYYDITGEVKVNESQYCLWDRFSDYMQESIITRDCILKNPINKELTINEFIDLFKEKNTNNIFEMTFNKEFAKEFAAMLKERFPHGLIIRHWDSNYFRFLYNGKYYGIFGEE